LEEEKNENEFPNTFNITKETSLLCVDLFVVFFVIEIFAARHLIRWLARPCCIVEGHRLVAGRLVERLVLEANVELAAVCGMRKSVVVAEAQPRVRADELMDNSGLTFGPLRLVGPRASQDCRAPNDAGAALSRSWVAVDAGRVLVALLRILGVEVAILSRTSWRWNWLLQLCPGFALHPLWVVARLSRDVVHKAILAKFWDQCTIGLAHVILVALHWVFHRVLANFWCALKVVDVNEISSRNQLLTEQEGLKLL